MRASVIQGHTVMRNTRSCFTLADKPIAQISVDQPNIILCTPGILLLSQVGFKG